MTLFSQALDADVPRRLASFARRFISDAHDADDVAQEALLRAARSSTAPRSVERTQAWLFRICRHAAIDHVRSRSVRRPVWLPMSDEEAASNLAAPTPESDEGVPRRGQLLARRLEGLPAHHRLLVVLHYQRTLPQAELCRRTGLSPAALRVRLHRARQALEGARVS